MSDYRKKFGAWGEDVAAKYLAGKGYTILVRNFKAERGEIDIIARHGNVIIFVEVKTGNSEKFGPPEEKITRSKQRQLYKVAALFIQQTEIPDVDYRFDAIIVDGTYQKHEIRHYQNAFYL